MLDEKAVDRVMAAARARAAALGIAVSIAIVDDGGYLLGVSRGDGAHKLTPQMAISKAYTSAIYRRPTEAMQQMPSELISVARLTALYPPLVMPGGVPIRIGEAFVGGIGVAGAAPAEDADCAASGADALA